MIALYRGKSLVSRAIKWQTRTPYSHAAWLKPDLTVYEAWHKGGMDKHYSPWAVHAYKTEIDLFAVNITAEQSEQVEQFLESICGAAYDWGMVARFVTRGRETMKSQERWFCSEAVFAAVAAAGVLLLREIKPCNVAPGYLAWSPLCIYQRTVTSLADFE